MYYVHTCSWCTKVFYTYHNNREEASKILYIGIKEHLVEYGEDHKEHEFDEDPTIEIDQMYAALVETEEEPAGGYEL